ncbi:hypothetical protein DXG03_001763 [Asterophora parasitica]|uniref:Uncharacterized protein n=1 Tax=Asterophora parasitica TaxID=117018 RepID=A0A9P7G574_9AGAR|nr:hypothetical protein DXG03_001763 [Asterophora parasitica]
MDTDNALQSDASSVLTSPPAISTSDPVLRSVEDFLQRNARRIHVKKYGRRRIRNCMVRSSSTPPSDSDEDQVDQLDGDEYIPQAPSAKCVKRQAIVYLDPDKGNLEGPTASAVRLTSLNRPALHLLPLDQAKPTRTERRKPRAARLWTTVDPKKGIPFRTASFSRTGSKDLGPGTLKSTTKRRPLTTWKSLDDTVLQAASLSADPRSNNTSTARRAISRCPPLSFISLADAEESYKHRDLHNRTRIKAKTSTQQRGEQLCAPAPLLFVPAFTHLQTFSDQNTKEVRSPPVDFTPSDNSVTLPREENGNELDAMRMSSTSTSSPVPILPPSKPMKPLVSFLDDFLEKARTSTQLHAALESEAFESCTKSKLGLILCRATTTTAPSVGLAPPRTIKSNQRISMRDVVSTKSNVPSQPTADVFSPPHFLRSPKLSHTYSSSSNATPEQAITNTGQQTASSSNVFTGSLMTIPTDSNYGVVGFEFAQEHQVD